jgi:hypothetical protein
LVEEVPADRTSARCRSQGGISIRIHGRRGVRVGAPGSRKRLPVVTSIARIAGKQQVSFRQQKRPPISIIGGQRVEFTVLWADGRDYTKRFHRHSAKLLSGLADGRYKSRLVEQYNDEERKVKREFYFFRLSM